MEGQYDSKIDTTCVLLDALISELSRSGDPSITQLIASHPDLVKYLREAAQHSQ